MSTPVKQEQNLPAQTGVKSLSNFLNSDAIKAKFVEVLGSKGTGFIASVLAACNLSEELKKCTPESVYTAALMAATLDLPINPNLSFAYIIPFKKNAGKPNETVEATFQISSRGLIQLAQRTGKYLRISSSVVYEGQLTGEDPLQGYTFDWKAKKSDKVIGYVSYFKLVNGFENTFYMSSEQIEKHAKRYSQTYRSSNEYVRKNSKWATDLEAMALKTVTKLNLSKYGPLSIEMEKALITDQAVIKDTDTLDVEYEDNKEERRDPERERLLSLIKEAKTIVKLEELAPNVMEYGLVEEYTQRENELKEAK
jgi:recombination protein RecT